MCLSDCFACFSCTARQTFNDTNKTTFYPRYSIEPVEYRNTYCSNQAFKWNMCENYLSCQVRKINRKTVIPVFSQPLKQAQEKYQDERGVKVARVHVPRHGQNVVSPFVYYSMPAWKKQHAYPEVTNISLETKLVTVLYSNSMTTRCVPTEH